MRIISFLRTSNTFEKITVYWKNESMNMSVYGQGRTGLAGKGVLPGDILLKA